MGALCWVLSCGVVRSVLSIFAIILLRRQSILLCLICVLAVVRLTVFESFPRGAMGWSEVCNCSNFLSYSLAISCQEKCMFQEILILSNKISYACGRFIINRL